MSCRSSFDDDDDEEQVDCVMKSLLLFVATEFRLDLIEGEELES